MSFDFMNFANQQANLGNAYEGIKQEAYDKTQSANNALTQAMKLTQLNFDSAAEGAKSLLDAGLEGLGGIEGANMLWKGGKKILQNEECTRGNFQCQFMHGINSCISLI